ncbi:sensor histidine kinase [Enterococcus sp.]|uniref:sensor histidine kinase n=1 Tax=Enterococcus sp. TaxID=35783 RepID=UPI0028B24B20|nr:sensor histidine kinase [Enterococcus sp.]
MNHLKTLLGFLKDRWLLLAAWLILFVLTVLVFWLIPHSPLDWGTVGYLFLMQCVLLVFFLAVSFLAKRRFWQKLTPRSGENLLQNYLQGARSVEEERIERYINQLISEHQELMQQVVGNQEEQKEYIDSWVHEIKVPLAASRLLLHAVEFDIPDDKFILLENELNRIDAYVEQVLYVSRLDSFSKDYLVQEVSIKSVIQPVLRNQANYFIQKNLHYKVVGDDQPILTDEKWLSFIFSQLVSNAVKYTPDNGQLTIQIDKDPQGTYLRLIDTGIGIPPEDLRRIFDKGFTGENGRKTDTHSTGLGLYLAKNLAKELGIELTAASTVGKGTTMTLFFPLLSYYEEIR